jgi:hypothetical protein
MRRKFPAGRTHTFPTITATFSQSSLCGDDSSVSVSRFAFFSREMQKNFKFWKFSSFLRMTRLTINVRDVTFPSGKSWRANFRCRICVTKVIESQFSNSKILLSFVGFALAK